MSIFRVNGGLKLYGRVRAIRAKNAALPILAATMLYPGKCEILSCPRITDIANMLSILEVLGCRVDFGEGVCAVDSAPAESWEMPEALAKRLRSSIFLLGPLIGRFRRARATYPGGCDIGLRPIDLHLKGLRALGVDIREERGVIYCDGSRLRGGYVHLDFPSVGATENVMMAAVLAPGRSIIHNAAREPEIVDLQRFINAMGGRVRGAGSGNIIIDGVSSLHSARYAPMGDRIVAGTLLAACAATRGEITVTGAPVSDMGAPIDKLRQAGCDIDIRGDEIAIGCEGRLRPFDISTQTHPGFPTDLQAQFMALACTIPGASMIVENLFESRFSHAAQLARMGADIYLRGRLAVVRGGKLTGARVEAGDLRAGAALVIAALAAEGETEIGNSELVDRGYEDFDAQLRSLGADIQRIGE